MVGREDREVAEAHAEAFTRLTDQELDHSFAVACLILGNRDDAEDAMHDALEAAWQRWESLREVERFRAWFGRIVTNACRDRVRHRRIAPITMSVLPDQATPDPSGGLAERELLRDSLRSLDVDHRVVLVLRYYEDLTVEEIARRLGERPGTVKSRLHYGLRTLRADLDAADRSAREDRR